MTLAVSPKVRGFKNARVLAAVFAALLMLASILAGVMGVLLISISILVQVIVLVLCDASLRKRTP